MRLAAAFALSFLLASSQVALAGQVLVVGPGPGQLHSIQDAILLSQPGDVVLVKAGNYSGFRIDDRRITIVAEAGANVQVTGSARVTNLSSTAPVVLSGLTLRGQPNPPLWELLHGLQAKNCVGTIVVEDCTLRGATSLGLVQPWHDLGDGVNANACSALLITDSTMNGGEGPLDYAGSTSWGECGNGVTFTGGGSLVLNRVSAVGGEWGYLRNPPYCDGLNGGNGVAITSGHLFAVGSTLRAGSGCWYGPCSLGWGWGYVGDGGIGLRAGANPSGSLTGLYLLNTVTLGVPMVCSAACAEPGYPQATSIPVINLAETERRLIAPRIKRDVGTLDFQIVGVPGERVELGISRTPSSTYVAAEANHLHVANAVWKPVGLIPASGTLTYSVPLADLPLSDPSRVLFTQARLRMPSGATRLTGVQTIVVVDSSY